MRDRFVIFCDESAKTGPHFSNFYGAALLRESDLEKITLHLRKVKQSLNLNNEVKYTRITQNYQQKYIELIREFFKFIKSGQIKVRIMFTQNIHAPILTKEQRDNGYFLLYYQLVKHGFGLQYVPGSGPVSLRINFDQFPHQGGQKSDSFKTFIHRLRRQPQFSNRGIFIERQDIAEVNSDDHEVLQCLDIILGCMQGRLNNSFDNKVPGKRLRTKRARAREAVYKSIYKEISDVYPGYSFNVGVSTKVNSSIEFRWSAPYSHWLFIPNEHKRNQDYKSKNK